MIVNLEAHDGFYGGGNILTVETTVEEIIEENPWLSVSREEIERKLLLTGRVRLGDDLWLVRVPHTTVVPGD